MCSADRITLFSVVTEIIERERERENNAKSLYEFESCDGDSRLSTYNLFFGVNPYKADRDSL